MGLSWFRMSRNPGRRVHDHRGIDATLALAIGVVSLGGHRLVTGAVPTDAPLAWLPYGLLAGSAAVLVVRRRQPLLAVAASTTAVVALLFVDEHHEGPFIILPLMVALYTATEAGQRRLAIGAASLIVAAFGLAALLHPTGGAVGLEGLLWVTGWLTATIVTGEVVKGQRAYLRAVEARATEAERTREEEGRRRAGEERLRIARELHDVLGHSLSVINVQAGTAAHVVGSRPEKAYEALEIIRQTSKQALQELRGTLSALEAPEQPGPRRPAPGMQQLDDLIELTSRTGVEVDLEVSGLPRRLSAALDQAAYRIVQESLTNVLRHADASTATVCMHYGSRDLHIQIEDDGRGLGDTPNLDRGAGLAGMRQRAIAMGGKLETDSAASGGFRVSAWLPLEHAP